MTFRLSIKGFLRATAIALAACVGLSGSVHAQSFTINSTTTTTVVVPPKLVPGTGFTDAYDAVVPDPIGDPTIDPTAALPAIARWDRVPYDMVTKSMNVGLLAYHINDIDHVEMSVDGGPVVSISSAILNTQTGAEEYFAVLDPTKFSARSVEVRATVFPVVGTPRVMEPLILNCRWPTVISSRYVATTGDDITGDGTLANPFQTLTRAIKSIQVNGQTCDGAVVYFMAGDYDFSNEPAPFVTVNADKAWFTLARYPGAAGTVRFTFFPDNGMNVQKLRIVDAYLGPGPVKGIYKPNQSLCLINVNFGGLGADVGPGGPAGGFASVYAINSSFHDLNNGFGSKGMLVRGCKFYKIGSDPLQGARMVVQTAISNVDRLTNLGFHPDLVQWHEPYTDNRIVYGLTADTNIQAQGIGSGETVSNIAIINTRLNNTGYGGAIFSFAGPTTHLIVRNSKFYGSSFWRTDKGFVPTSVLIDNSQFYNGSTNLLPKVYGPAVGDGITVR